MVIPPSYKQTIKLRGMLRTIYQVTDKELYNYTNEAADETYSIQLYFLETYAYDECLKRLANIFQIEDEGRTVHHGKVTYKVCVTGLSRGEGNDQQGFHSFTYNNKYIRVYWNNKQKKILFYSE
jgi:hypothetical protein